MVIDGSIRRHLSIAAHAEELRWCLTASRTPRLRSYRQFAEDEIVLPNTGPKGGRKFRCEYQPFSRLWFDAIGSRLFNRFAASGPSQSGKTLDCFVIPMVYHLFEKRENVIGFAPNMDICEDKWLIDVLPIIQKSRFAEFLPRRGGGSYGGFDELIRFTNGTYLKWMTGGGGDKNKAAITAKVGCGTEVDGMAEGTATSVESSPLNQIAARLRSHGSRALMFLECTVSTPDGIIWNEIKNGTDSRIVLPCPHCDHLVSPERENFVGWDGAATELEAERKGLFYCPDCATAWSPEQRRAANQQCRLVHRGQEITPTGEIVGPVPETRTFGFRWSAVNNQFAEESQIGLEEWKAARNPDRDVAEKERCQFVWCVPFVGEVTGIDIGEKMVASRLSGLPRGTLPNDYETLVVQIDLHNRWHYWTVMATSPGNVRTIVDYGLTWTPYNGEEVPDESIRLGLEALKAELAAKKWVTADGREQEIDLHLVDAGYCQDVGLAFVTANGPQWMLVKGDGEDYRSPKEKTLDLRPGSHWHHARQPACVASGKQKWWLAHAETHYWMRQVHGGFTASTFEDDEITRKPGSLALFGNDASVHLDQIDRKVARSAFATQLLAWKWEEVTSAKTGAQMKWVPQYGEGKHDHWFDTTYGCFVGDAIVRAYHPRFKPAVPVRQSQEKRSFQTPDGRPYFLTER